uniref:Secreted protein n=1 Tax=Pyxicephalus adspersus TaxID=30357 RepID=A0AAV3AHJ3_PYXAD|nr:TPA: hypothetical protein GDO54_012171 [Pyxicephalus adspersus]
MLKCIYLNSPLHYLLCKMFATCLFWLNGSSIAAKINQVTKTFSMSCDSFKDQTLFCTFLKVKNSIIAPGTFILIHTYPYV